MLTSRQPEMAGGRLLAAGPRSPGLGEPCASNGNREFQRGANGVEWAAALGGAGPGEPSQSWAISTQVLAGLQDKHPWGRE